MYFLGIFFISFYIDCSVAFCQPTMMMMMETRARQANVDESRF